MSKNYICNSNKHTLGGPASDTIALPVTISDLPYQIEVNGNILLRKTSFHASLVCIGKIIKKHAITTPDFLEKIINDFCDFTKDNDISFIRYRDEFCFAETNDRKSVIVMCEISNLDRFFDFLNKKYHLNLEYQPTHVSLFTLQPDKVIYLTDSDDIEQLTKVMPKPLGVSL